MFLADQVFDVAIVGGGILGLSVARDCAMRRLSVALFEKNDFGCGSTGQVPGFMSGEPYWLESERSRTRATCEEIQVFHRIAPNLLTRIPLLVPVLRSESKIRLTQLHAFGRTYDRFSALKGGRPTVALTAAQARELEPGLCQDIAGAVSWDEWGIDLLRLAMLTGKSAVAAGAQLFNRASVDKIELQDRRVVGLRIHPFGQQPAIVRARIVVNATGHWAPRLVGSSGLSLKLRFSKSVYLAFERRILNLALACSTRPAQRTPRLFSIDRTTYLGPVESPLTDLPNDVVATDTDVDFLYQAAQCYFPRIWEYRVASTQSAIRPYPIPMESEPPQSHILIDHSRQGAEGFYTVAGGNLAMCRRVAEQATDLICRRLRRREPCRTHLESLPGCIVEMPWLEESHRTGIDPITIRGLMARHGYKAHAILDAAMKNPQLAQTLCECEQILAAEVDYCVRKELALGIDDVSRRTRLGKGACQGGRCRHNTALFVGSLLNWNRERIGLETAGLRSEQDRVLVGEQAKQEDYNRWLAAGSPEG